MSDNYTEPTHSIPDKEGPTFFA